MTKNWYQRIDEAEKRGSFNQRDKRDAADWPTCACGEQSDVIETVDNKFSNEPKDQTLVNLGMDFYHIIRTGTRAACFDSIETSLAERYAENRFEAARICLDRIEHRANELVTEKIEQEKSMNRVEA